MKIWHKTLIIILIFFIALYLLILYVNQSLIPVKLKALIVKNISQYTRQEVDIESLKFSISKGFVLNKVKIYQGPKEKREFLFKSDKISFTAIFLPSFKKHILIIPRLNIDEPYLKLERLPDGNLNISSLLAKKAEPDKPSRFQLVVKGLFFDNGELSFTDYYEKKDFHKTINALNGSIGLSLPSSLSLNCSGNIDDKPVKIIAKYRPFEKELSINLNMEKLAITDYWNKYLAGEVKIYSGLCNGFLRADISDFKKINIKTNISIEQLKADIKDNTISGNYKLEGSASFNINGNLSAVYDLNLGLDKANVSTALKSIKIIKDIDGELSLSQNRWSFQKLSCMIYNSPAIIQGEIRNPHEDFIADITAESKLSLKEISDILKVNFEKGEAGIKAKLIYKKDGTYHVKGASQIKDVKLQQEDITIAGNFFINGESSGQSSDWKSLTYKGDVSFDGATIKGGELLPFISEASGEAAFSTKNITIKNLTGIAADTKIAIKGSIDYEEESPYLDMSLKADGLSLSKLLSTLPGELSAKFKNIDAKGICSLNIDFKGASGKPDTYSYIGEISLKDSSIAFPSWPYNVSDMNCDIEFQKQKITWKDLNFKIKDTIYYSYGTLNNFAQPKISSNIKSKNLDITIETNTDNNNIISISKLSGRYYNSPFSVTGKIKDIKTTNADIAGDIYLNLKDLPLIFSSHKNSIDKFSPSGIVKITFDMQGELNNPLDWTLFAEGTTDSIYISDFKLDDFYFDYRMKERFMEMPVLIAYPYGGIINISSRANLKTEDQPYIINIDIKDIDLGELIKDTKFKSKKIKGKFTAKTVLNGYISQKDSLQGNGWLQVSDGYLWEFPVMRGITELVLMVPPEYVVLTDAFGNFSVRNNRIYTEDFKILSKVASLLWVGSLGFDTTLDFNISGRFAEDVMKQTTEPGRIASAILREAGNLIMEIKLTGTLKNPNYQLVPFPMRKIFEEKVMDKFKDIFGNILE